MNLDGMGVMLTAWRRPEYLSQTLASWSRARGISEIRQMTIALGWAGNDMFMKQVETVDAAKRALGCKVRVKPDSSAARAARGMGYAIAEAITSLFDHNPDLQFVIASEEDIIVSDDVLEYFSWAASEFRDDPRVLIACAHTPAAQGWNEPGAGPREDPDSDPEAVRLIPEFSPWAWGTWRDRWERTLKVRWDYHCDSGGPVESGYDWAIQRRIIPQTGSVCAVPLASRSQNIGRDDGWAADPEQFEGTLSASFRPHREVCDYRVTAEAERAA